MEIEKGCPLWFDETETWGWTGWTQWTRRVAGDGSETWSAGLGTKSLSILHLRFSLLAVVLLVMERS